MIQGIEGRDKHVMQSKKLGPARYHKLSSARLGWRHQGLRTLMKEAYFTVQQQSAEGTSNSACLGCSWREGSTGRRKNKGRKMGPTTWAKGLPGFSATDPGFEPRFHLTSTSTQLPFKRYTSNCHMPAVSHSFCRIPAMALFCL